MTSDVLFNFSYHLFSAVIFLLLKNHGYFASFSVFRRYSLLPPDKILPDNKNTLNIANEC